jgi:tetratricopeptide (TPR) repeat protein
VRRLGRYEVFEEIAQGGMGVVLRARDPELNRDLAVKVLRPGLRDCPEAVRRFVEEAQITAQLPHPGVVPVHDIGRDDQGLPFLVMKLMRGQTLEELLAGPRDELGRWLGVFEQVCQAVAFAHSRRVIHRDLKPSNVMVGRFGEVQVMDWGLAKVLTEGSGGRQPPEVGAIQTVRQLEAGAYTQGALGTPSYMAPEQAGGSWERVDERADVFGLGGILCAILTGRPPYEGTSREEVMGKALRGEVAGAFARLAACRADDELVALARACLSPEVGERPRDAAEVAQRVAAYRAGVEQRLRAAEQERAAAQARAEEARATARAQAKARRRTVVLAGVVLLALALAGGAAAWYLKQRGWAQGEVRSALREADSHLAASRDLRDRDPERWDAAVRLAAAAMDRAQVAAGSAEVDRELRDRVAQKRAEVEQEGRDSALRLELDQVRLEQTALKKGRFDHTAAVPRYRGVLRGYGIDPADATASAQAIRASRLRGELVAALGDWARWTPDTVERARLVALLEAVDTAAEAKGRAWRAAVANKDGAALARLARAAAEELPAADVACLARDLIELRRSAAAVALLRRGRQRFTDDFWLNHDLGMALYRQDGSSGEGVPYLMVAAALRPQSAGTHNNLGSALLEKGDIDSALRCYQRAIDLDPKNPRAHNNLGNALKEKGDIDGALRCYQRAIDLDPKFPEAHNNRGLVLRVKGDPDGAIRCYRRALELNPKYFWAHNNLGVELLDKGDNDGAARCFRTASDLDPTNATAWANIGLALLRKGNADGAIPCCRRALKLDPKFALAHNNLGAALQTKGDMDGAIRCYREAIDVDPKCGYAHASLAQALLSRGEFAQAQEAARRALDLLPPRDGLRGRVSRWLPRCERGLALSAKLPAVLQGKARPADAAEALALAQLCQQHKQLYTAAARLYTGAFAAEPKLAEDLQAQNRYAAARSAALAAAGKGQDANQLDSNERGHWRQQALDWLRADLDARARQPADTKPAQRQAILQVLQHWRQDGDLAGVRDEKSLAALPAAQRDAWCKLWTDVAALLHKAHSPR